MVNIVQLLLTGTTVTAIKTAKTGEKVEQGTKYEYWVSNKTNMLNKECDDDHSNCIRQHATTQLSSNVELEYPSGEKHCWTHWIHGYDSMDSPEADVGIFKPGIANPSACQQLCQETEECVYWSYKGNTLYNSGSVYGDCLMKTEAEMENAQKTVINSEDTLVDSQWCNVTMPNACFGNYTCKTCGDYRRCIYHSDNHIAGPKFCSDMKDECGWAPPDSPTINPPGPPQPDPVPPTSGPGPTNGPTNGPTDGPGPSTTAGTGTGTNSTGTGSTHSTSSGDETTGGGGDHTGVIAGSVVGAAAVAGVVGVSAFMMRGGAAGAANTMAPSGNADMVDREEYVDVDPSQFA